MSKLQKKNSKAIGEIMRECLRVYGITPSINRRLIDEAWEKASGASEFTVRTFFRDGVYYVTVKSSVVRSQLIFQKDSLIEKMNDVLSGETLFDSDCKSAGFIRELVVK